jgi:hypothetical protein
MALTLSIVAVSMLRIFMPLNFWWVVPASLVLSAILVPFSGILNLSISYVASILDQRHPELEESTSLLLKPEQSMNLLEKLQVVKVSDRLQTIPASSLFIKNLKESALILVLGLGLSLGVSGIEASNESQTQRSGVNTNKPAAQNLIPDRLLPGIKSVSLTVNPPAYTRKKARQQNQFSVSAEDGSSLTWQITTIQPLKRVNLIFNDKEIVALRAVNKERTRWALNKTVTKPGFYQVDLEGSLSDLYKLEIIKDQPALIRIIKPAQYSSVDFGEPQRTALQLQINDDYGINDAYISATISSGQGEGVKFREQKLSFQQNFSGGASYKLNRTIDLKGLGMVPGDELYFYVQARDTRLQDSRSDIYIVTIQDTAQLMSMDGMIGGVNLVPEYFRSQRQIIIDTEKLLKERSSISTEQFNSRSNDIGVDQKLLRLRYGKFLGEEDESEIGGRQEDEHSDPADFGNPEAILDAVSHKHDQAEDATFFEPELKAQLKATLSEMWKSELQLRLYKPAAALPFEYKALRLLKDLQQKSRVYVAKTSFKPAPIRADKRLSGELDKIIQPQASRMLEAKENAQNSLRLTAGILSGSKTNKKLSAAEILTLTEGSRLLALRAAAQPGAFLGPLATMRAIIRSGKLNASSTKLRELEAALQKMISPEGRTPQARTNAPVNDLATEYFNNLKGNR